MSPTLFDMLKNNESNKIEEMEQTIADLYRLERSEADSDRNAGAKNQIPITRPLPTEHIGNHKIIKTP